MFPLRFAGICGKLQSLHQHRWYAQSAPTMPLRGLHLANSRACRLRLQYLPPRRRRAASFHRRVLVCQWLSDGMCCGATQCHHMRVFAQQPGKGCPRVDALHGASARGTGDAGARERHGPASRGPRGAEEGAGRREGGGRGTPDPGRRRRSSPARPWRVCGRWAASGRAATFGPEAEVRRNDRRTVSSRPCESARHPPARVPYSMRAPVWGCLTRSRAHMSARTHECTQRLAAPRNTTHLRPEVSNICSRSRNALKHSDLGPTQLRQSVVPKLRRVTAHASREVKGGRPRQSTFERHMLSSAPPEQAHAQSHRLTSSKMTVGAHLWQKRLSLLPGSLSQSPSRSRSSSRPLRVHPALSLSSP